MIDTTKFDLGILTEEELANALGHRGTSTLATWRHQKSGPDYVKLGNKVFYRTDDVRAWIETKRVSGSPSITEQVGKFLSGDKE